MFAFDLHRTPGGPVLALTGDLDTHAAGQLDTYLETLVGTLDRPLTVDLTELTYLNSTGIRSFIRLHKQLKATGQSFAFNGASAKIFRIFRYCGLDTFFTFEHLVTVVPPAPSVPAVSPALPESIS